MLTLRPYQTACVAAMLTDMDAGEKAIGVLPTGAGKSICIASLIDKTLKSAPDSHIFNITHSQELVAQNCAEFLEFCPEHETRTGVYSAGLGRKEIRRVTFAGIQSLFKKFHALQRCDMIIVDESHNVPHVGSDAKMWRTVFDDVANRFPHAKICGLTATDYRLDGGYLTEGKNAFFTKVSYEYSIMQGIEDGYLCNLRSLKMNFNINTKGIKKIAGDFSEADIEKIITGLPTETATKEIVKMGTDFGRKKWLIFGCGLKNCAEIKENLTGHGIKSEVIAGETPSVERADIIKRFKDPDSDLQALINHGVLTTGFNAPAVDLIAVLRPTESTSLWVQILGRGTRTFPFKDDCLVLDFGKNTERHGYLDCLKIKRKDAEGKGDGEPIVKTCPECDTHVPAASRSCPYCKYVFPKEEKTFELTVNKPLFSKEGKDADGTFEARLTRHEFRRHEKEGKPDSVHVRFSFRADGRTGNVNHYFCFDHGGYAAQKSRDVFNGIFCPVWIVDKSVNDALDWLNSGNAAIKNGLVRLREKGDFYNLVSVQPAELARLAG